MSNTDPAAVTTRYFDALAAGDFATVMSLLAEDVVWHQPGGNRFSGTHAGAAAVQQLVGGMMEVSGGSFQLSVAADPMFNGDHVAVPVRFRGERGEGRVDMGGLDLLRIVDGKITEVWLFSEDGPAEDRFWGAA